MGVRGLGTISRGNSSLTQFYELYQPLIMTLDLKSSQSIDLNATFHSTVCKQQHPKEVP
jgi:hypothetical protein